MVIPDPQKPIIVEVLLIKEPSIVLNILLLKMGIKDKNVPSPPPSNMDQFFSPPRANSFMFSVTQSVIQSGIQSVI